MATHDPKESRGKSRLGPLPKGPPRKKDPLDCTAAQDVLPDHVMAAALAPAGTHELDSLLEELSRSPDAAPTLAIGKMGGECRFVTLDRPELTVGRSRSNDVVLASDMVSGRHCRILSQDGKYTLVDLDSTNGTYLNGQRVFGSHEITKNDRIVIGEFILQLARTRPPPPPPPKRRQTAPPLGAAPPVMTSAPPLGNKPAPPRASPPPPPVADDGVTAQEKIVASLRAEQEIFQNKVLGELTELRRQIAQLAGRLDALEKRLPRPPPTKR